MLCVHLKCPVRCTNPKITSRLMFQALSHRFCILLLNLGVSLSSSLALPLLDQSQSTQTFLPQEEIKMRNAIYVMTLTLIGGLANAAPAQTQPIGIAGQLFTVT